MTENKLNELKQLNENIYKTNLEIITLLNDFESKSNIFSISNPVNLKWSSEPESNVVLFCCVEHCKRSSCNPSNIIDDIKDTLSNINSLYETNKCLELTPRMLFDDSPPKYDIPFPDKLINNIDDLIKSKQRRFCEVQSLKNNINTFDINEYLSQIINNISRNIILLEIDITFLRFIHCFLFKYCEIEKKTHSSIEMILLNMILFYIDNYTKYSSKGDRLLTKYQPKNISMNLNIIFHTFLYIYDIILDKNNCIEVDSRYADSDCFSILLLSKKIDTVVCSEEKYIADILKNISTYSSNIFDMLSNNTINCRLFGLKKIKLRTKPPKDGKYISIKYTS